MYLDTSLEQEQLLQSQELSSQKDKLAERVASNEAELLSWKADALDAREELRLLRNEREVQETELNYLRSLVNEHAEVLLKLKEAHAAEKESL